MKITNFSRFALVLGSLLAWVAVPEKLQADALATTNTFVLIPQTNWTLLFVDSQELSGPAQNGCCDPTPATNVFDGDPNTFWNTEWVTVQPNFPHEIQIDLGASYSIAGFRHLPRQDGRNNGRIKQYDFFVSTDGVNWGMPRASGSFPDTDQPTDVTFPGGPVGGRYIRLVSYSNYSVDGFSASMAELNVFADETTPPVIRRVIADPNILWPPNHKLRLVTINVDASASNGLMTTCEIVGVTANEQVAPNDVILTGGLSLRLRADRSGQPKEGRIYTITVRCTDISGNSSEALTTVTVPHSLRKPGKQGK